MRRTGFFAAIAVVLSIAATANAQTISVTFSTLNSGACAVGFADNCPSGTCVCQVYTGTVAGGTVGKGTATFSMTLDDGNETPSLASATGGVCVPIYADLAMTGSKDVEDDNLLGTFCDQANQNLPQPILGGYGVNSSNAGKTGNNGTFTGTYNHLKGTIK